MKPAHEAHILDVTLRDGSYLIDFQFSKSDTAIICKALEVNGIEWIEIGHGLGLHASEKGHGTAACTDEEYMQAAANNLVKAKWGMFFIPGIGRLEDIELAASYNMSFLRVGTNITDAVKAKPFIEAAKKKGMFVAYNGMKSYAVSPQEFAGIAKQVEAYGADMVCLVDSAGGFYPDDVEAYFSETSKVSSIPVGYHGHDNLSLVMANTLKAIDCGAFMVDTSLQGMGRSAGNAITEVLVAILKQKGFLPGVNLNGLIDLGHNYIQPLMTNQGRGPLAIISGYAKFHSSFTQKVTQYAQKYKLDVRDLIVKLCQEDQVNAPDELLERLSRELTGKRNIRNNSFTVQFSGSTNVMNPDEKLEQLLKEIRHRSIKNNKYGALNIVFGDHTEPLVISGNIQNTVNHIIGAVSVSDERKFNELLTKADGITDIILLDSDTPEQFQPVTITAGSILKKSILLSYSDSHAWTQAIEEQLVRMMKEDLNGKEIMISGNHFKSRMLAGKLAGRGAITRIITKGTATADEQLLFKKACELFQPQAEKKLNLELIPAADLTQEMLASSKFIVTWEQHDRVSKLLATGLDAGHTLIDAAIGSLPEDLVKTLTQQRIRVMRVNIWPVLSATLQFCHETFLVAFQDAGRRDFGGVHAVSGGVIGLKGDIIVDSIKKPTRIIGVANGSGQVIYDYDPETRDKINALENEINGHIINADFLTFNQTREKTIDLEPLHLLILGGNRLNIPAIGEAKKNGFFTYVADKNPDAKGFEAADVAVKADIANADELLKAIAAYPIQGIVSMAEAGVMAAAALSEKLGLNGISVEVASRATSKAAMREAWKDSEFSVGFFVVRNENEMIKAVKELNQFPLIMKPDRTFGGSRGVSRVDNINESKTAYQFAKDSGMNGLVIVEHCAEGNEFSCEVIIHKGKTTLLCIGEKVKSPFPYRVDCSVQYPARLSAVEETKVYEMCRFAVEKLGIKSGVAHIEFAYTKAGPRLFELGVRCGGGHTPVIAKHVSGINEFVAYAHVACGLAPELNPHAIKKGADYRFLIFPPGKIARIHYSQELIRQQGVLDFVLDIAEGSEIKPLQTTANRSGCVVTTSETRDEAVALADQICSQVSVEYSDKTISTASHFFQSA